MTELLCTGCGRRPVSKPSLKQECWRASRAALQDLQTSHCHSSSAGLDPCILCTSAAEMQVQMMKTQCNGAAACPHNMSGMWVVELSSQAAWMLVT